MTDAFNEPGLKPQDPGYVEIAAALAKMEMRSGNDATAVEVANLALPAAEVAGNENLTLDLLVTRGVALANIDRLTEAVVELTGALAVARRRGIHATAHRAATNLAYALDVDDPARAYEISRENFELARQTGLAWDIRYLLGNAADGALQVGDWDWAIDAITEQLEFLEAPAERIWYGTFLTTIRAYRGEPVDDEARRLYDESRGFDDAQYRGMGASSLVVTSLMNGDLPEVVRLCDEFLSTAGPSGADAAWWGAEAAIWMGDLVTARRMRESADNSRAGRRKDALLSEIEAGIAMLEGRAADARAAYANAQHGWREMGLPLWLAFCDLDIVITGAMEPDERRRAADEAREILERLRAQALIDRLDAALEADRSRAASPGSPARAPEVVR